MSVRNVQFPGGETYREKATRKFKENPIVPVGALATTAALVVATVKMRRGETRSFNHWLRFRVIAQGLTILAIIGGTYTLGAQNTERGRSQAQADLEARRVERLAKEKLEFEQRLRAAETLHNSEMGLAEGGRGASPTTLKSTSAPPPPTLTTDPVAPPASKSWWPWSTSGSG